MKKIESLNNAQKTVLQLEKEISAISNNLTKVKNKDHTTMKKIIHNINYLLSKNGYEKNLYQKEINEEKESNKKEETKCKIKKNYQYISNNDKNIDYFLLLNKQKNNNSQRNSNKPYFNRKCLSSSKINNNNISEEKKYFYNYNKESINIPNKENKENKENNNRNKIINYSENILSRANMTYSKPRLLTEYSKRNSNNNISYKNNTFNKNNRGSTGQIKNVKYLTLNEKVNNSCKNSMHKKPTILSTLYYNYKDNTENNTFLKNNILKENINKKKAISFEQPEINNKQKDLKDFIYEKEEKKISKYEYPNLESTSKKNKKFISDKKAKKNIKLNINNYNKNFFLKNKSNLNHNYNNGDFLNLKFEDEDLNKDSITDKKNIRNEKDNYIFSYGNQNMKKINNVLNYNNNNIEKNFNSWGNYKTQGNIKDHNNNYLRQNISKSLNSKNIMMNNSNIKKNKFQNNSNNDIGNDKERINLLLNMLNANNINDGIMKVKYLLNYEKDINKLKEVCSINNNGKYKIDKNGRWLSSIINNYKRNEKYKNFCQNIMIFYKIKNFEEFKIFIKSLLSKNRKNKRDYSNGKTINGKLDENNYYDKKINTIVNNKGNNSNLNKGNNLYIEENDKDNCSHNSQDIKFSNIENLKIITDYMHTYY